MWVYDDGFTDPTMVVQLQSRSVKNKVKNELDIYCTS